MKRINKIRVYSDNTLKIWSEGRLIRWRGRVKNHLDGILKEHKSKSGAKYDIQQFKNYIKDIDKILKEKKKNTYKIFELVDSNDDMSG